MPSLGVHFDSKVIITSLIAPDPWDSVESCLVPEQDDVVEQVDGVHGSVAVAQDERVDITGSIARSGERNRDLVGCASPVREAPYFILGMTRVVRDPPKVRAIPSIVDRHDVV